MKKLLLLLTVFTGMLLSAQNVPSYVPSSDIYGWWPFSGNTINQVTVGSSWNLGNNSATPTTDRFLDSNAAFNFQNNWMATSGISTQIGPSTASPFTISCWATKNGTDSIQTIASLQTSISVNGIEYSFELNYEGSGIRFSIGGFQGVDFMTGDYYGSRSYDASILIPTLAMSNDWNHFVGTYDSINSTLLLYINGNLVGTDSTGFTPNSSWGKNFELGKTDDYGLSNQQHYLDGKIDDVGIWGRALTAQEVYGLYISCGDSIQIQPQNQTFYTAASSNVNFVCSSSDSLASFAWEENDGSGWAALSNSSIFLGVNSDTLIISGATTFMDNNQYRCIVTSCKSDTSQAGTLTVIDNFGLFEDFQSTRMTIGPNPNDGHFTLEVDESIVGSDYKMTDELGRLIEKGKLQSTAQQFGLFGQPKGVYHISIISTNGIKTVSVVVQ
jgi:hypothetical protein